MFLSVLLLGKKGKNAADKILMLWMLILAIHLFIYYCVYTEITFRFPIIYGIGLPLPFLHGPLLYLYTSARIQRLPKNPLHISLHFLPALAIYLYYIPFFTADIPFQLTYIQQITSGNADWIYQSVFVIMLISGITYVAATLFFLHKYQSNLKIQTSNTQHRDLIWLRNLILGLGSVWIIVIAVNLWGKNIPGDNIIYASVVFFVVFMGYFGIRQVGVFTEPQIAHSPTSDSEKKRYQKSGLKPGQATKIKLALEKCMQKDLLYLESNLSLKILAEKTALPSNHISQVINQHYGKNFHDFVNTYRLSAFQAKISEGAHKEFTLLALAYACGFSSKATFNKFFKKEMGITPSAYVRDLGESPQTNHTS